MYQQELITHPSQTVLRLRAKDGKTPEDVANIVKNLKPELTSSTNIGLADFYPATSGKEKAAQHIVEKFNSRLEEAFLLCDDDNDLGELHRTHQHPSAITVISGCRLRIQTAWCFFMCHAAECLPAALFAAQLYIIWIR